MSKVILRAYYGVANHMTQRKGLTIVLVFLLSSIPAKPLIFAQEESPFGFHSAAVTWPQEYGIDHVYDFAVDIGVRWDRSVVCMFIWTIVQPDLSKEEYYWERYDMLMTQVPKGLSIVANIYIGIPAGDPSYLEYAISNSSFLPKDVNAYRQYVQAVVERYDGDGKKDLPGLSVPIKHWQIDNEPPHGMTDYAELLTIAFEAIKEADPGAKVIIGGVPGMPPPSFYLRKFDDVYLPILDQLSNSEKRCFDIFDFHWYGNATGDYQGVREVFEHIKEKVSALGLTPPDGYWITEMGTYSGDPAPVESLQYDFAYQTERQQAADLVKRYVYALSLGIKKIFMAFNIVEGFRNDGTYFDFTGLVYDGKFNSDLGQGVRKLGYYTYKKMTEFLEGSNWDNIQTVEELDGIHIYKLTNEGQPVWVAWNDNLEETEVTIPAIAFSHVQVTEAVPKHDSGEDVLDYENAFNRNTKSVQNGQAILKLGSTPVIVSVPASSPPPAPSGLRRY
jgi:hypothetical protein